uniref:Uncharacterized protein n=1 Tax=Rhizophora mucronata TaxID=61149 RepID=A0A2P2N5S7_RHIMU
MYMMYLAMCQRSINQQVEVVVKLSGISCVINILHETYS